MSTNPNPTKQESYTKPQPVVFLGSIIAGITATLSALTLIFKDNPTVILVLGIVGAIVTGVTIAKDQYVKSVVVPYVDTAQYINENGEVVAGPASPLPTGTDMASGVTQAVQGLGLNVLSAGDLAIDESGFDGQGDPLPEAGKDVGA